MGVLERLDYISSRYILGRRQPKEGDPSLLHCTLLYGSSMFQPDTWYPTAAATAATAATDHLLIAVHERPGSWSKYSGSEFGIVTGLQNGAHLCGGTFPRLPQPPTLRLQVFCTGGRSQSVASACLRINLAFWLLTCPCPSIDIKPSSLLSRVSNYRRQKRPFLPNIEVPCVF